MATIYEVSKRAGVSLATVSRVLNNSGRVTERTRQKVLAAMAELDYRPNSIAQSLASNRSNSVGIMVPELHGPFFGTLITGIEQVLREAGKHTIVTVGHSNEAEEKDGIDFLVSRRCDALILHVDAVSDEFIVELDDGPVPVVLVNRLVPQVEEKCIRLDNFHGGRIATAYLLELGHRDIAYISGPLWKSDARDRLAGHKQALADAGVEFDTRLFFEGDFQEPSGSDGMRRFLALDVPFTAVVCANDGMAAGAMRAAREEGLQIPGDVSVVGFDNVTFSAYLYPNLSTINYPAMQIGQMAGRWVLKQVYGRDDLEVQKLFEPTLIVRESARPLAP
ncbi:MAG TPA: LacI family DNA-binding transcriptional regulator [Woeseiaceae bacterium]|nr:LacI family DNA-binding transcriptional regulator [Woeseiaceae bacterium]